MNGHKERLPDSDDLIIGGFHTCPRCQSHAYERFDGHDYCPSCNYSEVTDEPYRVPYHVQYMLEQKGQAKHFDTKIGKLNTPMVRRDKEDKQPEKEAS